MTEKQKNDMTFKQLEEKLGPQEKSDWTQHENGQGFFFKTAKVDKTAYIYGIVFGLAQVYGNAWVYGNARVYGDARVYGNARVSGDARVYGDARVSGDAWVKSPLFIIGTRFALTNCKKGHIQIGCYCHTFKEWRELGPKLAAENSFTPEEITEYTAYLDLFEKIGK